MTNRTEPSDAVGAGSPSLPSPFSSPPSGGAYAIRAAGVGKRYRIYPSQRARLLHLLSLGRRSPPRDLWAVRGFDLGMRPGEVLGVVGENGAGKSTLLKLMTGTAVPTEGELEVRGRVGALLELGVGFHPEFTGRDNARLTASLMGLGPEATEAALPEIEAFSELGPFLEQPVKFYSSGMVVRLGFSIAASIDPDVLVIDEALSVGDQYFQKKSLDRILDFRDAGKTILFCSHSLYHVRHLCPRAVWMHEGRVRLEGGADEVLNAYESAVREREKHLRHQEEDLAADTETRPGLASIENLTLHPDGGEPGTTATSGRPVEVRVRFRVGEEAGEGVHVAVGFRRNDGVVAAAFATNNEDLPPRPGPEGEAVCAMDRMLLLPGRYLLTAVLLDATGHCLYDRRDRWIEIDGPRDNLGVVALPHRWDP